MRKLPRKICIHCSTNIPVNVYSRNHGDKCPYKDAPPDQKKCKCCEEFQSIESFAKLTVRTFDGRSSTCNSCLTKKYYVPKQAV